MDFEFFKLGKFCLKYPLYGQEDIHINKSPDSIDFKFFKPR